MLLATSPVTYWRAARAIGPNPRDQARLLWAFSKNARVAVGLARHHPTFVYTLATRYGAVHLRDNVGDVTNLPGLLGENCYRVRELDSDGEILDVGANIGLFAKWIHAHNPERRVHCFEPLPENAKLIGLNCPEALVKLACVGRAPGRVAIGVDRFEMMASSIAQPWELRPREFEVVALDDYAHAHDIREVAFLKIDTEGMEIDVLDGAKAVLERTHRIALETHAPDWHLAVLGRLREIGFRIDAEVRHAVTGMVWASHG